jgi:hypothetical protein
VSKDLRVLPFSFVQIVLSQLVGISFLCLLYISPLSLINKSVLKRLELLVSEFRSFIPITILMFAALAALKSLSVVLFGIETPFSTSFAYKSLSSLDL